MFSKGVVQLLGCKRIVKMVDSSACEVIDTGTVKVTKRNGTVCALEAVWYVPEAQYNPISIRVLGKEECRIQVQQCVVTIIQGDEVILEGERCGGLYKLKKENSVRGGVFRDKLGKGSLRGGASRKNCNRTRIGSKCCGKENTKEGGQDREIQKKYREPMWRTSLTGRQSGQNAVTQHYKIQKKYRKRWRTPWKPRQGARRR